MSAAVAVAAAQLPMARGYAQHRLRAARARSTGFLHPVDVTLTTNTLSLTFLPGALDQAPGRPRSFTEWRDGHLLPLIALLVRCHDAEIIGLGAHPPVDARWVPPVGWFLPSPAGTTRLLDKHAFRAAADWIVAEGRADRTGPGVPSFLDALRDFDVARLRRLVNETASTAQSDRQPTDVPPPSFLSLLTEGELLERVSTLYHYRLLRPQEATDLGIDPAGQFILEIDRSWADPHFTKLKRPSPQEVWDTLVDESRVTPVLALSERLPNPLDSRIGKDLPVRWIGVHADQPFVYLRRDVRHLPPHGFVRLHLAGDNALMERKRAFTRFSGAHPTLSRWIHSPPRPTPFQDNPQPRDGLEDAILASRGVFAVQGPPGTGKTHLATEVVRRFLTRAPEGRVLICAKEHFALDHILRKITTALGRDGLPFRAWRSVSLAKQRRSRGEVDETWQSQAVTQDLGGRQWAQSASEWSQWQAATSDLHDQRLASLGQQAANLFFATTMDASMVQFLERESFDLVIVEEAGKCYPSELLHALCLGRISLMIGDQRQLPPYQERRTREGVEAWQTALNKAARDEKVRSEMRTRFGTLYAELDALMRLDAPVGEAEQAWLRPFEFLFERLATRHRLEEQFRMEAPLSRAVGSVFYGRPFNHRKDELVTAGVLEARPLAEVVPPEFDVPMVWLDTPHMSEEPDATEDAAKRGTRDNAYEVAVVTAYLRRLRPGAPIDLVILTPYNAQKRLLLESPELRAVCGRLTQVPFDQVVRTTDEYQGREAELTVLSLVRNNSLGARAWGFMTEPERLNVMFSRTRFRQVVVASSAHIERHAEECASLARFWGAYRTEARDPSCARILPAGEVLHG